MTDARLALPPTPPARADAPAPARAALDAAVAANSAAGHELAGALSSTHGFLPLKVPALALPAGYEAWDEVARDLPRHFLSATLRPTVDALPPFDAEALPPSFLQRAATLVGLIAQSYWHCEVRPCEGGLPASVDAAWRDITARLGRPAPVLSYVDGIVNNWRHPAPSAGGTYDPLLLDPARLGLLVPTVDNPAERLFYLTQVAILGHTAPLVEAACRMQECVLTDDVQGLKALLVHLQDALDHVSRVTLMAIDTHPSAATYVDQTVWTKLVASTFIPIKPGVVGPSGTSSPVIHLLDVLLGRERYDAAHISHETTAIRQHFPSQWRAFLDAVAAVPVVAYVRRRGDAELDGLLAGVLLGYAGDAGLLERHRLKVYGFLDTAFKIGRDVTIGGYDQNVQRNTWEVIHADLLRTREERTHPHPGASLSHVGLALSSTPASSVRTGGVHLVRLDVAGRGVRYQPGDRVSVLPRNSRELVQRTLDAFGLAGDEPVALDEAWRRALSLRPAWRASPVPPQLPVHEVLACARLRPLQRETLLCLADLAPSGLLASIVDEHLEDEFELWDIVVLARERCPRFDHAAIVQMLATPGLAAKVLRPEAPRTYSIASRPDGGDGPSRTIELLIRDWQYRTADTTTTTIPALAHTVPQLTRQGAASGLLVRAGATPRDRADALFARHDRLGDGRLGRRQAKELLRAQGFGERGFDDLWRQVAGDAGSIDVAGLAALLDAAGAARDDEADRQVVLRIVSPPRFRLPQDLARPVVMFAGGTGLSPFRGFWQQRAVQGASMNLLYFSTTTPEHLYLRGELEAAEAAGRLRTRIGFTRAPVFARFDPDRAQFALEPGAPTRIDALIEEEREASHLYRMLLPRERGGLEGHFYICGQSGFAQSVLDALGRIVLRFHPGVPASDDPDPQTVLRNLFAERRLCLEVFTTHSSARDLPAYRVSDLCLRNDDRYGWWIAVGGRILDVTEFRLLHPGGATIIENYAGLDASAAYASVGHHRSSEVHAMASMYEVGRLETLRLPDHPAGSRGDGRPCTLAQTLAVWTSALANVTEIENIQRNESSLQDRALGDAARDAEHMLRAQHAIECHARAQARAFEPLLGPLLDELWDVSLAAPGSTDDRAWLGQSVAGLRDGPQALRRRALPASLWAAYDAIPRDPAHPRWRRLGLALASLRELDALFLRDCKMLLRDGLLRFEGVGHATVGSIGERLVEILRRLPPILRAYQEVTDAVASELAAAPSQADAPGQALVDRMRKREPGLRRTLRDLVVASATRVEGYPVQVCASGEHVVREGDLGSTAYLVEAGRCEVYRVVKGRRVHIRVMRAGDVFGERALLAAGRRTASVVVLDNDTRLRVVERAAFRREIEDASPWMQSLVQTLAARLIAARE